MCIAWKSETWFSHNLGFANASRTGFICCESGNGQISKAHSKYLRRMDSLKESYIVAPRQKLGEGRRT